MYTTRELGGLLSALQTSKAQQAPDAEIVASAFDLDQNIEYSLGYCEKKLYDISKEIKLLQARLRFLELEEESGHIAKRRARNRLQPMVRLPDEMISNIVRFSMRRYDASIWRSPVLALSHRWRECALNESLVWQHILIVADTKKDELSTWLARSRNAPLSILYNFPKGSKALLEHFAMIQPLIVPHADRIRNLIYDVHSPPNFLFPLSINSPSLKFLHVNWKRSVSSTSPYNVFGEGSQSGLRKLWLHAWAGTPAQVVLNDFDASALVEFHVDAAVTTPSIWSTLSRSHLLKDLRWLDLVGSENVDVGPSDLSRLGLAPISLKRLRSLFLAGPKTLSILAHLDTSALKRLDIGFFPANGRQDLTPEILRRDQLQRLALRRIGPLQAKQLRDIFTALPQLEYFIYDAWTAESIPVLEILIPPGTVKSRDNMGFSCGPSLRVLSLGYKLPASGIVPESPAHTEFVQAMNKHVRPLLLKRRMYASQPLTVILKHTEMLDGFLGLEGIEWDDNYQLPVD